MTTSQDKTCTPTSDNNEWEEFERVCRPVVEFLQKRYLLHAHIIIDWDRATLVKDLKGMPFKVPN